MIIITTPEKGLSPCLTYTKSVHIAMQVGGHGHRGFKPSYHNNNGDNAKHAPMKGKQVDEIFFPSVAS